MTEKKHVVKSLYHFIETQHSEEIIKKVIEEHRNSIRHYAYIPHLRDRNPDGTKKDSHWHVLLYLASTREPTAVQGWFDRHIEETANTRRPELCESLGLAYDYLTHKLHPTKTQYSEADIRSDDIAFFQKCARDEEKKHKTRFNYAQLILNGNGTPEAGGIKYGSFDTIDVLIIKDEEPLWARTTLLRNDEGYYFADFPDIVPFGSWIRGKN